MATFSCLNDTSMEINFQLLKKKKKKTLNLLLPIKLELQHQSVHCKTYDFFKKLILLIS